MTRKRLLSIALNWGTEDNATKLADGYNWNPRTVQQLLDQQMRPEDWKFVQGIWGMFEKYGPMIDDLQRKTTGVGIEFVKGRTIDSPHGAIEGKYFPLVYDASKSIVAERNLERTHDALFEGNQYFKSTTRNGSTISRVSGVKQPVDLSLDILPFKIAQTIHDLAFRESVMQADKLLSDRRVIKAMDDSFGPEIRKTMRPWLQHIANTSNVNDEAMGFLDKFLNGARANVTAVGIGFRLSTMFKHGTTALFNSFGEVGPKYMLQGLRESFGTRGQNDRGWKFAINESKELKYRRDQYDRDLHNNLQDWIEKGTLSRVNAKVQELGHAGVSFFDFGTAVPTWIGAFRKAQDQGMEHDDAVAYADKQLRNAHGAQGLIDRAPIQDSQSQLVKMLTMFYGFFNHIYNQQADTVRTARMIPGQIGQGNVRGAARNFSTVLGRTWFYLVIPAIVEALAQGGPNENKDEGWMEWAGKAIAEEIPAGIPILRDVAKSAIEGHDYEPSPLSRAVKTIVGTSKDIASDVGLREKDPNAHQLQHVLETAGYMSGTPTGQAGTVAQFIWDVSEGKQDPQSLADWIDGLMHGHMAKEK
jgi:hypothetical protein